MLLHLKRKWFTSKSTIGELLVDGEFECYTLEDELRSIKVPGETAIPGGTYKIVINHSNRFGRKLPLLENVPNFEGIRIHIGNWPKDTAGCILVGKERGKDFIGKSGDAFKALFDKIQAAIADEEVFIKITEENQS